MHRLHKTVAKNTEATEANMNGGLRERKRAATQEKIERAAISLALEHGF